MPKDSPLVGTVATDPNGGQWKQLDQLVSKFPFVGQGKGQLKAMFNQQTGLDFDADLKPVLGNDMVFASPSPNALRRGSNNVLLALKAKDEGKAQDLVKKDATKVATVDGADVYRERSGTVLTLKDGLLVFAPSETDLKAALDRHAGSDHMTTADLDARLAGLKGDALLKVGVNAQQLIASSPDPSAKTAQRVKWVGALRDVGVFVAAKPDGVQVDFRTTSNGGLTDKDLPLEAGSQSAPVVRRADEVGFGLRNPSQIVAFVQAAMGATNPKGFGRYEAQKAKTNVKLGVDIDRDVLSQFVGDTAVSVGIDGSFAVQSALRDPAAFQRTLHTAAPRLPAVERKRGLQVIAPTTPNGLYTATTSSGRKYAFGMIGPKFVVATDAVRAADFVKQSASTVPGAKGSVTMAADARSLANAAAQRAGQGAAGLFTGALGDVTGWVDSETSGLTGRLKLQIK